MPEGEKKIVPLGNVIGQVIPVSVQVAVSFISGSPCHISAFDKFLHVFRITGSLQVH